MNKYSLRMILLGVLCVVSMVGVIGCFAGYEQFAIIGAMAYVLTLAIYWGLYMGGAIYVVFFEAVLFLVMLAFGLPIFNSAITTLTCGVVVNSIAVVLYLKTYVADPWSTYISMPV